MEVHFLAWPLPSRNAAWTKGEATRLGITEQPPEFLTRTLKWEKWLSFSRKSITEFCIYQHGLLLELQGLFLGKIF